MANKNLELEGAYNDYVTQLQKNKISARNAIASSTEKAKSLLDNRLKSQGLSNSGVGLSQYTALANQQNANLASLNNEYNNNLAQYQQAYNEQMKNEAMSLLPNMSSDKATEYLDSLKQNGNLYSDTTNYLDMYLKSLNNQRSEQAVQNAKNDMSNLATYDQVQQYINSLKGLTPEQISELQNYANVIGADWKTDRDTYVDELSEIVDVMRKNDNTADTSKYYSAFQQLSGAKPQEEYNKLLKDLDIKSLVNGAGGNKQYLNDYSNLSKMKVGDSLPVQTLEYLVNLNFVQKDGNNYVTTDGNKKYVFDSTGKLISGGNKTVETEYEGKEPDVSEAEIKSLKSRLDLQIGKVMSNASLSNGLKKQLEAFPSKTEYNSNGKETGTLYKVGNTTYRINKLGVLEKVK